MVGRVADISNWIHGGHGIVSSSATSLDTKNAICQKFPVSPAFHLHILVNDVHHQKFKLWHKDIVCHAASLLQGTSCHVAGPNLVQLYTKSCEDEGKKHARQIMLNFRKAAFHLQYLLQVIFIMFFNPFPVIDYVQGKLDVPKSTEDIESELREMLGKHLETCSEQDKNLIVQDEMVQMWENGRPKIATVRTALFMALTISPLVLLLPNKLDGKKLGLDVMVRVRILYFIFLSLASDINSPLSLLALDRSW